jgi:fermentation-respiration switch protein FrsA (DUF1100 family)
LGVSTAAGCEHEAAEERTDCQIRPNATHLPIPLNRFLDHPASSSASDIVPKPTIAWQSQRRHGLSRSEGNKPQTRSRRVDSNPTDSRP